MAIFATAVSSVACYTYRPSEISSLEPGQEVRVYLTRAAVAALPEDVPASSLSVSGRLVERSVDSLSVGIPLGQRDPGTLSSDLRQVVKMGSREVVDVQIREFSRGRSALMVAGGVLGVAAVASFIFDSRSSLTDGDPDEDASVVPPFSLRWLLSFP